jgi:hypothetical protein
MPKGHPKQSTQAQSNGKVLSKTDAVRRALAEMGNDAMPLQMKDYIRRQMGVDMSTDHISNYKSKLLRAGNAKKKPGPKPKTAPAAVRTTTPGGISIDDVRAVKELADRIGSDKVRQLVEVLG